MRAFASLLRTFVVRNLTREPSRALLTVAGIALGVAVLVAVRIANRSSIDAFKAGIEAVSGAVSLEVYSPSGSIDEPILTELLWLERYGDWSPVIERAVTVEASAPPGSAPRPRVARLLGVDLLSDRAMRDYRALDPRDGGTAALLEALGDLTRSASALVGAELAAATGATPGENLRVRFGDRTVALPVSAVLDDAGGGKGSGDADGGTGAGAWADELIVVDIATAQTLFGGTGSIDRIDVLLHQDQALDAVEQEIAARLPSALAVRDPGERSRQSERMAASFHFNLTALAGLSLVVGLFLTYTTVSFSVARRRREIGRLRAVGVSRRVLFALFSGEAALLALPGVVLGVLGGRALASLALGATAGTVERFFIAEAAGRATSAPGLAGSDWWFALGVAFPLCLVAALRPAWEASRVPPAATARSQALVAEGTQRLWPSLVAAAAMLVLALLLCRIEPPGDIPVFATLGAFFLVAAASVMAGPALRGACRLFRAGRPEHTETLLATANLRSASSRLAVSAAALTGTLGMTVAIAVLVGSFRETVSLWLQTSLAGDIVVQPATPAPPGGSAPVSTAATGLVRSTEGVGSTEGIRRRTIEYEGSPVTLAVGSFQQSGSSGRFSFKRPRESAASVLGDADRLRSAIVSESFSFRFGKGVGDELSLPTPRGEVTLGVAGVFYDYSDTRGGVFIDAEAWRAHFATSATGRPADEGYDSLVVFAADGYAARAVKAELESTAAAAGHQLVFTTTGDVLDIALGVFDDTFAVTQALKVVALAIAAIGVTAALLTLLMERSREIATLRLIGATSRQIRRVVVTEAVMIGSAAYVLGTLLGIALSAVLVFVINVQSFGWTIQFQIPWLWIAQCGLFVLLGAAVSALWPALRATRILPNQV